MTGDSGWPIRFKAVFCGVCRYFERQFEIAEATKLPLFLHMRAAAPDFLDIVVGNQHK